jgi:hypothetical protein
MHVRTFSQNGKPGIVVKDGMAMPPRKSNAMLSKFSTKPKDADMYLLHFIGINLKANPMANGFLDMSSFTCLQVYYMVLFSLAFS